MVPHHTFAKHKPLSTQLLTNIGPTFTNALTRRHKVVITDDCKSKKHVRGEDDMKDDGTMTTLYA